eukprot:1333450-Amorphochlora_amoeboformis.AAC.2
MRIKLWLAGQFVCVILVEGYRGGSYPQSFWRVETHAGRTNLWSVPALVQGLSLWRRTRDEYRGIMDHHEYFSTRVWETLEREFAST